MKNVLILLVGATALALGLVGYLSLTPEGGAPLDFLSALYRSLSLFVLNPGPEGLPSGEPAWAVALVHVACFLAPLSLASFVVEAVLAVVRGGKRSYRAKTEHTIVCGLGRTAAMIIERLVAREGAASVIVVEINPDNPLLPRVRELGVGVVMGDMQEEAVLLDAGVALARRFLALAPKDILNINASTTARGLHRGKRLRAFAQVTDAGLLENLPERLKKEVTFLNPYRIAADALVKLKRLTRGYEDTYVIVGFGNFGQMVLRALLEDPATAQGDIFFVVDRDGAEKLRIFADTFGHDPAPLFPVPGNLHDPAVWEGLRASIEEEGATKKRKPIALICTDNDVLNLSLSLSIRRRFLPDAAIYTRMFGEVSFEAEMISGEKIATYRVAELLQKNLRFLQPVH